MRIKPAFKYQLNDYKFPVIIFFGIMIAIYAVNYILSFFVNGNFMMDTSVNAIIFLLVLGLNSFRESFGMVIQNGTSRKTFMTSKIFALLIVSLVTALADIITLELFLSFSQNNGSFVISNIFMPDTGILSIKYLWYSLLRISVYFMSITVGFFLTLLYYKLNKAGKLAVSIGVPGFLFIILPLMSMNETLSKILAKLLDALVYILGFRGEVFHPEFALISAIIISAVLFLLNWLMLRRAIIKK